jgi:hypothetical protein
MILMEFHHHLKLHHQQEQTFEREQNERKVFYAVLVYTECPPKSLSRIDYLINKNRDFMFHM